MEPAYYSLSVSIHRVAETYRVELSHSDPNSDAQVAPVRGIAALDASALLPLQLDGAAFGKALVAQLLSDPPVASRFVQIETAAQASSSFLRLMVCIDPSAQELQSLRWELLRHPQTGEALASSERVLFSRFMVTRDFRPVKLRAKQPNPDKLHQRRHRIRRSWMVGRARDP